MLCVQWRTALYNNHEYRMSIIFADPFRSFARNKIITLELARACATAQDDPQARFKHLPLEGSEGMLRDEDEHRGGGTGPAGPVLAGPLFSDQVINMHKLR